MYSHVATGATAAGVPALAAASGVAPVGVAVIFGTAVACMAGLIGLLRFVHRAS